MIISASRRTDIPAFYSGWFLNRLKAGFVFVQNPRNPHFVSRISLEQNAVDFIVFWTKNPENMISRLDSLDAYGIPYYFLFTITSYSRDIEIDLPDKQRVIEIFVRLAERIGTDRVIWRYDPIFLTDKIGFYDHYRFFDFIADKLRGYTRKCIISFLVLYKKCLRNLQSVALAELNQEKMIEIASTLNSIAKHYDMKLETCAMELDLDETGIKHGKCIDDQLISKIIGKPIHAKKDKSQRDACCCVESIDIGAYNTCLHHCLYCYANEDREAVEKNYALHDDHSPLLVGQLSDSDQVVERQLHTCVSIQQELFDT